MNKSRSPLCLICRIAAMGSAFATIAVFLMMLYLSAPLLKNGQLLDIVYGAWNPRHSQYGIYPMLIGSIWVALLGLAFSLPISLGTAFVAAVLGPAPLRRILGPLIRLMAGIPTVVYGFVAVFLLVPIMRDHCIAGSGYSLLTASLVLAVLIAPTMIVFFVNGLHSVPQPYCAAVDALGGRPVQKLLYLLLPQAWPAVVGGALLGFGRAMGDTLISLMLAGNSIAMPETVVQSGRTLTAHIALVLASDVASLQFRSIFTCGVILYLFTFVVVTVLRRLSPPRLSQ